MSQQPAAVPEGAKSDLEKRLDQLSSDLNASKKETVDAKKALEDKTKEARQHQAERDRITQRALTPPAARPALRPPTVPAGARSQVPTRQEEEPIDLREFANAQAKEIMLLREAITRGLPMEEVQDLEFSTPAELKLQLELIQQKKELANLKQQIEATQEPKAEEPKSSGPKIDAGGPSGSVDTGDQVLLMRQRAKDLRLQGNYKEATWITLEATKQEQLQKLQSGG
jgi:hypothetical protein